MATGLADFGGARHPGVLLYRIKVDIHSIRLGAKFTRACAHKDICNILIGYTGIQWSTLCTMYTRVWGLERGPSELTILGGSVFACVRDSLSLCMCISISLSVFFFISLPPGCLSVCSQVLSPSNLSSFSSSLLSHFL